MKTSLNMLTSGGAPVDIALPTTASKGRSKFAFSLPKAGSTMLYNLLRKACDTCILPLTYFSLMDEAYSKGISSAGIPAEASSLLEADGYLYGGFRAIPRKLELPPWASSNAILLVRDPRDMVISLYFSQAFSHVPPGTTISSNEYIKFLETREAIKAQSISAFCLSKTSTLLRQFALIEAKLDQSEVKTYRYEDVVFRKGWWLEDMMVYFGYPLSSAESARITAEFDIVPEVEDPLQHIRRVTPGDYQEKLDRETIGVLTDRFSGILATYGYQP